MHCMPCVLQGRFPLIIFQREQALRQDGAAVEALPREQVRAGLRIQLLVGVVAMLHDLRNGIQNEDQERPDEQAIKSRASS